MNIFGSDWYQRCFIFCSNISLIKKIKKVKSISLLTMPKGYIEPIWIFNKLLKPAYGSVHECGYEWSGTGTCYAPRKINIYTTTKDYMLRLWNWHHNMSLIQTSEQKQVKKIQPRLSCLNNLAVPEALLVL